MTRHNRKAVESTFTGLEGYMLEAISMSDDCKAQAKRLLRSLKSVMRMTKTREATIAIMVEYGFPEGFAVFLIDNRRMIEAMADGRRVVSSHGHA